MAFNMRDAESVPGLVTATDLSAKQYYAVKISAAKTVAIASTGDGIGVLQNAPVAGRAAEVCVEGVFMGLLGGTVAAGDRLTSDSAGKLVKITLDLSGAPTTVVTQIGMALMPGDDGERIPILGTPGAFAPS